MSTELIIELPKQDALQVFVEPSGIDPYLEKIRNEALSHVPDLSTKSGRAAIASIAAKVARSKTYLDEAGKQLCDQERAKIDATLSAVLDSRKLIRASLDDLRDEVRKPLTDWENAEAEQKDKIESRIEAMKRLPEIGSDAAAIEKHLKRLELTEIDESFGEYTAEAAIARTHAIRDCQGRLDAQIKIENGLKEFANKLPGNKEDWKTEFIHNSRTDKEENTRIADAEYRQRVIEESMQSFVEYGYSEESASATVMLIEQGHIKNIFIKF